MIKISPLLKNDLFGSLQSTWNSGSTQKQQFSNIFSTDSFFSQNTNAKPSATGNNIVQGSNNQMQGVNNKISGSTNSLIGMNTTIVGDLNQAFGLNNIIFGDKNQIAKGNDNKIKGS
jgi:hypothetical protein